MKDEKLINYDNLQNLNLEEKQINLLRKAINLFPQVPLGMTNYQIETFVLQTTEFPTWYAVYYQCILEIWSRFKAIMETVNSVIEVKLKNAIVEEKMQKENSVNVKKLLLHKIQVNEMRNEIAKHELKQKFNELETFEKVMQIAKQKMEKIPKYGDTDEESIKWILKFMLNGHPLRTSLVSGNMVDDLKKVKDYLMENKSFDEKSIEIIKQNIKKYVGAI